MAEENLGTAVLTIEIRDQQAQDALRKLRQDINTINRTASSAGTSRRTSGGARESTQALERAQSRRFALSQRIERLEERGAAVARLRSRLGDLTTAQSQRQFGTARQISVELDRQVKLANARFRREQDTAAVIARQARLGGPRESITGRRGLPGSPADVAFLARQGGARSPVGGAVNIPGSPAFLAAQQRSAQQQAALLSAEIARQARLGGARSSVRGATDIPGSPAFLAAQKRAGEIQARAYTTEISRLARQGGARSPVGGAVDIPGSPAFLAAQRRFSAQNLSRAAAIGGPRSPLGGALNLPGSPAALQAEQRLAEARIKAAKAANDAAVAEGRRIGRLNASPIRGGAAFPGSPAVIEAEKALTSARRRSAEAAQRAASAETERTKKEAARRRADVVSNALIGGAFPLLFGQGAGAALGGAVGGGAGGLLGGQFGFGGSLVGTALGAALDVAIEKTKTLAQGLDSPIKNFDALKEAALLSSKSVEKNAESLILAGRTQEAAVLIQEDLQRTFGNTESAERLIKASDELNRAWTEVSTATAFFVAGPLADFLAKLRERISPPTTEAAAQERAAEQSRIGSTFKNVGLGVATLGLGVSASGVGVLPGLATAGVGGILAGIGAAVEGQPRPRVPAQGDPVKQEQLRIAAAQEYQDILKKENQLIITQAQGYDGIAASLERQLIIARAAAAKKADPIQALKIEQDAQKELNKLAERELERKQAIQVQASLEAAQNKLKSQSIAEQIAATQALGKAERGVARDTLATTQAIQLGINEARRREQEIGAQIDAARQRGGDAGEQEASRLVEQQKIAANETRLELEKGALALTEAGIQLRDSLREAIVEFTAIRSDAEGLNKFLNPQQQQQRAEQDLQLLLPQFRQAQGRFTQLTGANAPEFSGPTAGVNDAIRDFIQRVQREGKAADTVAGTNSSLIGVNEALTRTTGNLAIAVGELTKKNWAVNVAVSGAQSAISGDVLNGAVSP